MAKGMKSSAVHRDELGAGTVLESIGAETAESAAELDPERAALQILRSFVGTSEGAAVAPSDVGGSHAEFKSVGIDKIPFTGNSVVKFRQYYYKVPVYGSLVTVELSGQNQFVSINTSVGEPANVDPVAKLSPAKALQVVAKWAGYERGVPGQPARLNFYFDAEHSRWRLVYIVEDVQRRKPSRSAQPAAPTGVPEFSDFVVDAHTGEKVAELPRTQTMAETSVEAQAADSLGRPRTFFVATDSSTNESRLFDALRNIHTHNFEFRDARLQFGSLPGKYVGNPPSPWDSGAVSAHANSTEVVDFLKTVLMRNGLDGMGGKIVSSVNCTWFGETFGREWRNAARLPNQMIYGQRLVDGELRSYAASLEVVAHELLHGLTDHTARLEYVFESGALNESYSDIFGIIVANRSEPDIGQWNWEIGEDLNATGIPLRDMSDPTRRNQPAHMNDYRELSEDEDHGGVHINSGIHNKAAHNIIVTKQDGQFLFNAVEVARVFYMTLTSQLSRTSGFLDSRRGALQSARSLFSNDANKDAKIAAVDAGFAAVGIVDAVA
ncbi:peptidase M4 [Mesorhizobium sp. L-8-10]|uniref:M4 family metallopeptidase n=1 Tax=unclassified Mesorhizobium TaxID=325217 RepID=UPI001925BA26|nr:MULTISPECIES: M4 family metallopeptidase [unclassified Mesorhizobium]BCH20444.1 peptidase M4 [Mesorhizobium sp. L-8-3]BCH28298.1 peptidase M4 [Mesorhizobium sp. L-8-10]